MSVAECFPRVVDLLGSGMELPAKAFIVTFPYLVAPSRHDDHEAEIPGTRMFFPVENRQKVNPHTFASLCCSHFAVAEPSGKFKSDPATVCAFGYKIRRICTYGHGHEGYAV